MNFIIKNTIKAKYLLKKSVVVFVMFVVVASQLFAGGVIFKNKTAEAAINKQINYQGKLTTAANVAVSDGTYHMKFYLYNVATGGSPLWTEDRSTAAGDRITVTSGLFSAMLGSSTPLTTVDFNQTLYLGVEIGGKTGSPSWDGEMTPRKIVGAVPAAFVADTLDNISSEQFLRADASNATSTATSWLSFVQNGVGKIAEFFGPSSASVFSVLSGGNIGVGTTTPYAKLSVVGQVVATNFFATSSNATNYFMGTTTVGTMSDSSKLTVSAGDYLVEIGDIDDARGVHTGDQSGNTGSLADTGSGAGVNGTGSVYGVLGSNNSASGYALFGQQNNASGYSVYASGGKSYFQGNVGIGTSSPYAPLSVLGQIVGSYFTATTSTASTFPYASTTMISATTASTTNLTISGVAGCSGSSALNTSSSGVVSCGAITGFSTFSYPFTSATNFGVNTSATSTALWAQAGIMASSTSYFVNASTTNLTVASNAYFSGGFWDSNGYVGIGTTTPDTKLTVFGGISAVGALGSNLVTNGDFTTDLTGWSGTNWSQSSGGALHTAGSLAPLLSSTFTSTIGETYRVDFDIVGASAGYGKMYFAGNYGKDAIGNGTFTEYITAATTTGFMFYPETDFNGRIDNVSIRLLTTTATSTIETPIEFRKKIIVDDRIEFPMGKPVIIGYGALPNNEKGTYNISSSNVCIGYEACKNVKTGQVTAIGYQAGRSADYDLGSDFEASLTAVGKWAGYANTSGHASFFGNAAGRSNTTAVSHCFGDESCAHVTTGAVSAFGSYSLYENIAGFSAAFGKNAGRNGTTTIGASYFGEDAGYNNFQGLVTIMGYQAAYNNTYGEPTVFGYQSGYQNTIGQITGFGTYAGYRNTTGRLIAIGRYAGADGTNGPRTDTGGILIGDNATRGVGFATQLTNYVGIGDAVSVDKSNQVVLGNSSIVETILRGKVGIGTSTPYATLSVVGQTVGAYFTATTSTASTFPYASTTMISATTASTTNLTISGVAGCSGSSALNTSSSGVVSCGAITGFSTFSYPFTSATNFGVNTSATSTALWAQAGIMASSTSYFPLGTWNSSGYVGIGTTSPLYTLHVASTTSATTGTQDVMAVEITTSGTPAVGFGPSILFKDAGSNADHMARIAAVYEAISGGGGTKGGALSFYTNPLAAAGSANLTERMRISLDGKVGIGTTSPYATLSVVGQVVGAYFTATTSTASTFPYASSTAFTASGTGYFGGLSVGSTSPWAQFSINPNGIGSGPMFAIGSSTQTNLVVTNTGRVGIGTTSPSGTFAVQGKAGGITGLTTGDSIFLTGGTAGGFAAGGRVVITGGLGADNGLDQDTNGGAIAITGGATTGIYGGGLGGDVTIDGGAASSGTVGNILLGATNFGKVGIGTTSPYAKLSVVGQVVGAYFTATTSTASTFPYASTTMISATTASTTNLTISGISACSGSNALTTNSSGVVACGAISGGGGTYPFTPTTNFGVNTSATSTALWAQAGIYASSTSYFPLGTWNSSGFLGVGTTTPWGMLSVNGDALSGAPQFVVGSSTKTDLIVTDGGYVGVGTTSPSAMFALTGRSATTGAAPLAFYVAGGTGGTSSLGGGITLVTGTGGARSLGTPAGAGGNFIVTSGTGGAHSGAGAGGVGGALTITGGDGGTSGSGAGGAGASITINPGAGGVGGGSNGAAGNILLATTVGNVGIGTTSPYAKLSVVGQVVGAYFTATTSTASTFPYASSTAFTASGTGYFGGLSVGSTSPWAQFSINPDGITGPSFAIGSSSATSFLIDNGGKVMIGTTTTLSTDKLSINGGNLFIRNLTPQFVLVDTATTDSNFGMRMQNGYAHLFRANSNSSLSAYLISFDVGNAYSGFATSVPKARISLVAGTTAAAGINFGDDTNLYRSAASVLKTDDDVSVGSGVYLDSTSSGRIYASGGLVNLSSSNNSRFRTTNGGGIIDRNIADSNATLTVTQLHASATGNILELRNNSATTTVFTQAGSLGVGSTTPWRTFSVVGTVAMNGLTSSATGNAVCITTGKDITDAGGGTCTPSSIRFKENIETLSEGSALEKIAQMRVVNFDYKEGSYSPEDGPHSVGLIAEEVEEIDPKLVDYGYDGQPLTLHFERLTGLSIQAIQELADRVSALEAQTMSAPPVLSDPSSESIVDVLVSYLNNMGVVISDGVAQFKNLVSETLTVGSREKPAGITLYDEVTGDPYCLKISNGKTKTEEGECGFVESTDTGAGSDTTTSQTQNPQDGDGGENGEEAGEENSEEEVAPPVDEVVNDSENSSDKEIPPPADTEAPAGDGDSEGDGAGA